jgi:hypothetical protein
MKEEWLMSGAVVPVDVETTAALVAEIHRLIGVVGGMALAQPVQEPEPDELTIAYMSGLYDGKKKRPWVGLTDEEIWGAVNRIGTSDSNVNPYQTIKDARAIEAKLKEKNT